MDDYKFIKTRLQSLKSNCLKIKKTAYDSHQDIHPYNNKHQKTDRELSEKNRKPSADLDGRRTEMKN
jgi:hypothetical protein